MDANLDDWEYNGEENYHEEAVESENGDVNTFAKGKGKGKGKAKGKGKTEFRGWCYGCGAYGHSNKYCPNNPKGKGKSKNQVYQQTWKGHGGKGNLDAGKGMNFYGKGRDDYECNFPAMTLEKNDALKTDNGTWHIPTKTVKPKKKEHVLYKSYAGLTKFDALTDMEQDDDYGEGEIPETQGSCVKAKRWTRVQKETAAKLVNILEKESRELHKVSQSDWIPLPKPIVVDSGAGETVMPADWLPAHPLRESAGSQNNEYYTTADGSKVYNEGQKSVFVSTPDGKQERAMTFQVAQVHKALGSVSQMVRNGNTVVFDTDEHGQDVSYIMNKKTQDYIPMRVENGVYVIDVVVAPPEYHPLQKHNAGMNSRSWGFPRQG